MSAKAERLAVQDTMARELAEEKRIDHIRAKLRGERLRRIVNEIGDHLLAGGRFTPSQINELKGIVGSAICEELYPGAAVDV